MFRAAMPSFARMLNNTTRSSQRSIAYTKAVHTAVTSLDASASRQLYSTTTAQQQQQQPLKGAAAFEATTRYNNITAGIESKVGVNLHQQLNHPINIIKQRIQSYFHNVYTDPQHTVAGPISNNNSSSSSPQHLFHFADNLHPKVSTTQNFDDLFITPQHMSRSPSDTFYYNDHTCLRTHTSAHEKQMLQAGHSAFLIAGDCYRRDEIDANHYPVFHQMEGVRVFEAETVAFAVTQLQQTLLGLARHLFGPDVVTRWDYDVTFPWTHPSFDLYVEFNGQWLEVLGCGILKQQSLQAAGMNNHVAWAFGMGLDRLAMVLFGVPDIRLFWSSDIRFLSQFSDNNLCSKFVPFSKYPMCYKDATFWLPKATAQATAEVIATATAAEHLEAAVALTGWRDNDFSAIVREIAGDIVEQIQCVDTYQNSNSHRVSKCFRITYRDNSRSLTNEEVDALQNKVIALSVKSLGIEMR